MASPDHDESAAFTEQARWLIEQHNNRSEAFTTRAVALLGFEGVILALLLQGAGLDGMTASGWTWTWLLLTIAALTRQGGWEPLGKPAGRVWTDDYASILPHLTWRRFL